MARAQAVGCTTLVLTVDLPVVVNATRRTKRRQRPDARAKQLRRGADLFTHTKWVRDVALGGRPLTFGNLEKALPDANVPATSRPGWPGSSIPV